MTTPFEERGWKKTDRFIVLQGASTIEPGSIVSLFKDDGTDSPLFKVEEGYSTFEICDDEMGAYVDLDNLELIPRSNVPEHYDSSIQPWDYMKTNFSAAEWRGYLKGNIIKYLHRYQNKGGLADLYKMRDYEKELIKLEEGE